MRIRMVAPLTSEDIADLRKQHYQSWSLAEDGDGPVQECAACGQGWPCDFTDLLAAFDRARAEERMERAMTAEHMAGYARQSERDRLEAQLTTTSEATRAAIVSAVRAFVQRVEPTWWETITYHAGQVRMCRACSWIDLPGRSMRHADVGCWLLPTHDELAALERQISDEGERGPS